MAPQDFEEVRNAKGVLYKLTAKLSSTKNVNVSLVPKSRLIYFHINDDGKSKRVSLSLAEALAFKGVLATMDPKINELMKSAPTQSKKRKLEANDTIAETEALLAELNYYQSYGYREDGHASAVTNEATGAGSQQQAYGVQQAYGAHSDAYTPSVSGYAATCQPQNDSQYQPQHTNNKQPPVTATNVPSYWTTGQYDPSTSEAARWQQPPPSYQPQQYAPIPQYASYQEAVTPMSKNAPYQ